MFFVKCQVVAIAVATTFFTAPLAAAPFAYITNQLDDSVSVIDTEQGKVVDTISCARQAGRRSGCTCGR